MKKSRKINPTKRRRTIRRKMTGGTTNPNYNHVNKSNLGNLIGHAKRFRKKANDIKKESEQNPDDTKLQKKAEKAKEIADEKEKIIDDFINSFEGRKPRENWKNENLERNHPVNGVQSTDWFSGDANTKTGTERKGW
jgi:hypothetical protein